MAKKLEDFMVIINMPGWHIRGYRPLSKGQVVEGKDIHPRMVVALKNKETFFDKGGAGLCPVCELKGGKADELEEAMKAAAEAPKPAPKAQPAPEPKIEKPAMKTEPQPESEPAADTEKPAIKKTPRKATQD